MSVPTGKILVPVSKVGRLEPDGKPWKETQMLTPLQRSGEKWCRTSDDELKLWKAPGRNGDLYLLWPSGMATASGLQKIMQKKAVLTANGQDFAFCGGETDAPMVSSGVQYD